MTKTVKKAIETQKSLNPYKNRTEERVEAYLALWNAMKTLRNLDIITTEEWDAIYDADHKMFSIASIAE